ncbi:MAG: PhnD/SsuA/transferrin family substrate-binding protein [Cyanobacteria bacterium P01_D01_bin.156]
MIGRRLFLGHSLLFLSGCALTHATGHSPNSPLPRPSKLRFTVTDLSSLDVLQKDFGDFRQALADVLQMPVEFFPVENYSAAAPAFLANELDFALAGPSEYLLLRARADAAPIVGITRPNYVSMIMTRVDGEIDQLSELNNKKIAMRTEGSTSGHIVPMKMLLDAGVAPDAYEVQMLNLEGFEALRSGQVDAWADSYSRYLEYVKEPGLEGTEIRVIATSENLPPDILVANPNLGPEFLAELRKQILQHQGVLMSALLASEANQKYKHSELVSVEDIDYQTLRDSYHAIGQGSTIE